jgi:senataxin
MQLPATVMSPLAARMGYDRSLFERLQLLGSPMLMLDVQYRMHPKISHFPREQFYNGKVQKI